MDFFFLSKLEEVFNLIYQQHFLEYVCYRSFGYMILISKVLKLLDIKYNATFLMLLFLLYSQSKLTWRDIYLKKQS